jgi:hypothetical protein
MRPPRLRPRDVTVFLASAVLVVATSGCGPEPAEPASGRSVENTAMTETEYVEIMAALNVALEEGLLGEDALARARELGAKIFTRTEIEQFAERLKEDPTKWTRIERRVHERVTELMSLPRTSP